VQQSDTR